MVSWKTAKNLLCLRLDALGDLLMTTPAIKALKDAVPGRKITLLTSKEGALIAPYTALFDEIIIYEAPWVKSSQNKDNVADDFSMIRKLSDRKFDGAIIFTVYSQNPLPGAMLCYLGQIPLRASFCRENPYALLTHWIKEEEPFKTLRHEVRRHLDLVDYLIGETSANSPLVLKTPNSDKVVLKKIIGRDFANPIVIHPGSTAESRRYHTKGFSELTKLLLASGKKVVFTGTENEKHIVDEILQNTDVKDGVLNLSGKLSLGEFIALIGEASVLISNNSGPVHIAAALGTPVVDIYALTNPQHTPWMVKHSLLFHQVQCAYCYKSICPEFHNDCINLISVERIFNETLDLLKIGPDTRDENAVNPIFLEERP